MDSAVIIPLLVAIIGAVAAVYQGLRAEAEKRERQRVELKMQFALEEAITRLLRHQKYDLRKFDTLKQCFRGLEDNELRRALIRAGAVSFQSDDGKTEYWGLIERNEARLGAVVDVDERAR